jgi:hypothetical protein
MAEFTDGWRAEEKARVVALEARLRESGLALPAWVVLECARPFGWLLGQLCLVAMPMARGVGLSHPLAEMMHWLDTPERLAALSEALAPDRGAK